MATSPVRPRPPLDPAEFGPGCIMAGCAHGDRCEAVTGGFHSEDPLANWTNIGDRCWVLEAAGGIYAEIFAHGGIAHFAVGEGVVDLVQSTSPTVQQAARAAQLGIEALAAGVEL